jgi:hypothetical protein
VFTQFVAFEGLETQPRASRDEYKYGVLENSVVRKVFELKQYQVKEQFRKSHDKKHHEVYRLLSVFRMVRSVGGAGGMRVYDFGDKPFS